MLNQPLHSKPQKRDYLLKLIRAFEESELINPNTCKILKNVMEIQKQLVLKYHDYYLTSYHAKNPNQSSTIYELTLSSNQPITNLFIISARLKLCVGFY